MKFLQIVHYSPTLLEIKSSRSEWNQSKRHTKEEKKLLKKEMQSTQSMLLYLEV